MQVKLFSDHVKYGRVAGVKVRLSVTKILTRTPVNKGFSSISCFNLIKTSTMIWPGDLQHRNMLFIVIGGDSVFHFVS